MKHRIDRVRELVKRELGDLIRRELSFDQLVTIQEVDMTPDLKQAHVYVSVLGGEDGAGRSVISRLQSHRKELQALLARRVVLKYTPHLYFKLDEAVARGTDVISILESLDLPPLPEGYDPAAEAEEEARKAAAKFEKAGDEEESVEEESDEASDEEASDEDDRPSRE